MIQDFSMSSMGTCNPEIHRVIWEDKHYLLEKPNGQQHTTFVKQIAFIIKFDTSI
jgi:hypothetical protein